MKCTKCKQGDLIVVDNIVTMNKNGKTVYDHEFLRCPVCGTNYEIDRIGTGGRPQDSVMSHVALFLIAGIITIPIAAIVGIIDLVKGDPTKTHTGSILAIVAAYILVCIIIIVVAFN